MRARGLRQMDGQSTPATADIQDLVVRPEHQFRGDMVELKDLCFLKRHLWISKKGTRILTPRVQKQLIEVTGKIVMVRHILARTAKRVGLTKAPPRKANAGQTRINFSDWLATCVTTKKH
jgi:hypothetical protein